MPVAAAGERRWSAGRPGAAWSRSRRRPARAGCAERPVEHVAQGRRHRGDGEELLIAALPAAGEVGGVVDGRRRRRARRAAAGAGAGAGGAASARPRPGRRGRAPRTPRRGLGRLLGAGARARRRDAEAAGRAAASPGRRRPRPVRRGDRRPARASADDRASSRRRERRASAQRRHAGGVARRSVRSSGAAAAGGRGRRRGRWPGWPGAPVGTAAGSGAGTATGAAGAGAVARGWRDDAVGRTRRRRGVPSVGPVRPAVGACRRAIARLDRRRRRTAVAGRGRARSAEPAR